MNILLDTFETVFPNVRNITEYLENIEDIDKNFIIPPDKKRALEYLEYTYNIYKWFI